MKGGARGTPRAREGLMNTGLLSPFDALIATLSPKYQGNQRPCPGGFLGSLQW